jgi:hypothetical protein
VVVGFECSSDPESYTGGSVATGRSTQAGQVEGWEPDEEGYPGLPGWGLDVRLTTSHRKIKLFRNPEEGQGSQRAVVPMMMISPLPIRLQGAVLN